MRKAIIAAFGGMLVSGVILASPAHATTYDDCISNARASSGNNSGLVAMCCTGAQLTGQPTGPECNQSNQAPKP
jgi:hypothetical protein